MRKLAIALLLLGATTLFATPCRWKGSYVYSFGADNTISMSGNAPIGDLQRVRERLGDNFLWARIESRSYVIYDASKLAEVRELFAPVRAVGREMAEVDREEETLDEKIDALSDDDDTSNDGEIAPLRATMKEIHRRQRELDRKESELECAAEKKLWSMIDEAIRSKSARPLD
jgi:hypothetical protein